MPITKDTGVTVEAVDVINDILPFCHQGVDGRDMLAQADYAADLQRTIGHQPGIARQELANKQARQVSHMSAGLAQFLARRYAAGVKDDGDLDKVEAAIVEALYAVIGPSLPGLAKVGTPGIVMPDGTTIVIDATGKISTKAQAMDPVGGIRFFEDEAPRAGYVPCLGTTISNFSTTYPEMAAYLSTTYGAARLVTLAQYNTLHTAIWATLADGSTVGWNGIGGVTKFVWDKAADTLKMPDLQEMFRSSTGASLGVGGTHIDMIRPATGKVTAVYGAAGESVMGVFYRQDNSAVHTASGYGVSYSDLYFDISRKTPVGNANKPRAWGALACCYLGQPA
ncbi:hypothetical protein [Desulfovibrio sp. QI0434]